MHLCLHFHDLLIGYRSWNKKTLPGLKPGRVSITDMADV